MSQLGKKAVIWAIDPFATENKSNAFLTADLPRWIEKSHAVLQPVYILSSAPDQKDAIRLEEAEKVAREYVEKMGLKKVRQPRILMDSPLSTTEAEKTLLKVADDENAPWIVVSSHGRSGVERMILGSFAESLLRLSARPILFLGQERKRPVTHGKARILFPTDFSDSSRIAFDQFVGQARELDLEVVLFHVVWLPTLAVGSEAGLVLLDDYFAEQARWAEAEGLRWVHRANALGVSAEVIVEEGGVGSRVASLILEAAAKQKVEMIAMASVSTGFSALVAGSIAQEVFRARQFPVWIYGPKAVQKKRAAPVAKLVEGAKL